MSHHQNNYNQMAKHLMILGTASHVGKSVLAAAFCHIFSKTAPTDRDCAGDTGMGCRNRSYSGYEPGSLKAEGRPALAGDHPWQARV